MNDQQNMTPNETLLANLLDRADKKFVSLVGVTALAMLADEMPQDHFEALLSDAVANAHALQQHKIMNANVKAQPSTSSNSSAAGPQQAAPGATQ
jgi:hypothetical protein